MIALEPQGKPEGAPAQAEVGEVSASTSDGPYTHRVHNVGSNAFEVVDVEFLQRPKQASEAAAAVVAENPSARVYKWALAPGASTPQHTHKRPYLVVVATALHLKMSSPDGKTLSHQVKPGDVHWVDSEVTHSLTNEGAAEGQIVEIELK
jgi:quercetin dioxygenase-like cupin family protein